MSSSDTRSPSTRTRARGGKPASPSGTSSVSTTSLCARTLRRPRRPGRPPARRRPPSRPRAPRAQQSSSDRRSRVRGSAHGPSSPSASSMVGGDGDPERRVDRLERGGKDVLGSLVPGGRSLRSSASASAGSERAPTGRHSPGHRGCRAGTQRLELAAAERADRRSRGCGRRSLGRVSAARLGGGGASAGGAVLGAFVGLRGRWTIELGDAGRRRPGRMRACACRPRWVPPRRCAPDTSRSARRWPPRRRTRGR